MIGRVWSMRERKLLVMSTSARVALHQPGAPDIEIKTVELPDPAPHQLLVRVESSGVCRSQIREMAMHTDGAPLPLGHEGLGVIEAIGSAVTEFSVGDRVILSWMPLAGAGIREAEWVTLPLPEGSTTYNTTVFTWATHTLVDEQFAIPVQNDDTDSALALVGCALITGFGSAVYAGNAQIGENVVVIGAGGVGLAAVVGAANAGAAQVAVIDIDDEKLDFAATLGATHTINSTRQDPVTAVHSLMQHQGASGADLVIDCVGITPTLTQAVACARGTTLGAGAGGRIVLAGLGDGEMSFSSSEFIFQQKTIIGTLAGGMGREEILQVMHAIRHGQIDAGAMVTDEFSLDQLNLSLEKLRAGEILGRGILVF